MPALPYTKSEAEFDKLDLDTPVFSAAAREVARVGNVSGECHRICAGSLPVFSVGDEVVLKFFPPHERAPGNREAQLLEFLNGRLPAPVPALLDRVELDGWEALIMGRLRGAAWADVAKDMNAEDLNRIAAQAGELAAALHALDISQLDLGDQPWPEFLAERYDGAVERQEKLGASAHWVDQIEDWLRRTKLDASPHSLLHTEIMREHLFVEQRDGQWNLTGLLDFEPSRIGPPEYELSSIGVFVSCGNPAVFERYLLSYGYAPDELNADLQRRCMAWALLHRYSNLRGYLQRLPVGPDVLDFDGLARAWWPLGNNGSGSR